MPGWSVRPHEADGLRAVVVLAPDGAPRFGVHVEWSSTTTSKIGKFFDVLFRTGRIATDSTCVVTPAGGEPVPCAPAKSSPWRRSSNTRILQLFGRQYRYRHRTDRRAVVERDGRVIARLHRTWQWGSWGRRSAYEDPGFTVVATTDWDDADASVVFLCGAVLGPPGREGFIGTLGQELLSGI